MAVDVVTVVAWAIATCARGTAMVTAKAVVMRRCVTVNVGTWGAPASVPFFD